jgi:glycosyltransferase involved in cell wall biosynthesis
VLSVREGNGAQAARNLGIRTGRADVVAFLDSDDEWSTHLLARCLARLRESRRQAAYTEGTIVRADTGRVEAALGVARLEADPYATLLWRPPGPVFSSLVVRRQALLDIGALDESLVAFQEWDTCLRLARACGPFAFVDEPLWTWYRHGAGTISADGQRNAAGYAQVVAKYRPAMLTHGGRRLLAVHYGQITQLYRRLGSRRRAWLYGVRTAAASVACAAVWAAALRHACRQTDGRDAASLTTQRRVYG